ncbi:MAG: SurA N-terminal domain-containing protein [Pseudomonadota bacterium]
MLQSLRNSSQSWVMRIFLCLLAIGFIGFFGSGVDFAQIWGGGRNPVVITIGSRKITASELVGRMQKLAATKLPPGTDLTPYKNLIKEQVKQQIITETLLDLEVERLGLIVGDAQVRRAIQSMDPFLDEDGYFDKQRFAGVLYSMQTSEKEFIEIIRRELQRKQLVQALISGVLAPNNMVAPFLAWMQEKRTVELLEVIASEVAAPLPTPEQIETFYKDNPKLFTAPEHRTISLIALTPEAVLAQVQLSEEEIAEEFETRHKAGSRLLTEAQSDKVLQEIKQERAEKLFHELSIQIEDDLGSGSSLEEISQSHGLPLVRLTKVQANRTFQPAPNSAPLSQTLIKDVVAQAFETGINEDIDLVETDMGAFLALRVEKITPATIKPLAEVRNEVIKYWQQNQQMQAATKKAQSIVDAPQALQGLNSFAQDKALRHKAGITLTRSPDDHTDLIPPKLRHDIFASALNTPVMGTTANGFVIARVTNIQRDKGPASTQDLDKLSKRLQIQLQDDVINELLDALYRQYGYEENKKALEAI